MRRRKKSQTDTSKPHLEMAEIGTYRTKESKSIGLWLACASKPIHGEAKRPEKNRLDYIALYEQSTSLLLFFAFWIIARRYPIDSKHRRKSNALQCTCINKSSQAT